MIIRGRSVTKRQWMPLLLVFLLFAAGAGAGAYHYLTRPVGPLPAVVRDELTFSPFVVPSTAKGYMATDYEVSRAEDGTQVLNYVITTEKAVINLSEYSQPPQFSEIPEYKERFLSNIIKQYATVQTANGTVYLGRMDKQSDKQLGVMIERGLLVLMAPDKDLDESAWRSLGDQLQIQTVIN